MDEYGKVWELVKKQKKVFVLVPDNEPDIKYFCRRIQLRKRRDRSINTDLNKKYKLHFERLARPDATKPIIKVCITLQETDAYHAGTLL